MRSLASSYGQIPCRAKHKYVVQEASDIRHSKYILISDKIVLVVNEGMFRAWLRNCKFWCNFVAQL